MKNIANFITGFNAVVLGLIVFVTYRYFEVQALFFRYLPLQENIRFAASILVAFVVVFSLLIFSAHIDRFKLSKYGSGEWIKRLMFVFTLFINAFFWQVWITDKDSNSSTADVWLILGFKITITIFFATFDYAFNHLFISLWNEKNTEAKLNQSLSQLELKASKLELSTSKAQAKLSQLIAADDPKVCPRCARNFDNPNQRNGHLRSCKESMLNVI